MHFSSYLASAILLLSTANALSLPADAHPLAIRSADALSDLAEDISLSIERSSLEKRKGGGGKGGGSSGGGKTSSSSSSSSSSRTSTTSNVGGQTKSGSGVKPAYGGGKYYAGGASVPYTSGGKTPKGLAPAALIPAAGLGFFGGLWLYGAFMYTYPHHYTFTNHSQTNATNPDGTNTTLPVNCLCAQYATCGCDDNDDTAFLDSVVGNGSAAALNASIAQIADVNGTKALYLNGTLDNGTTAAGGTDDAAGMLRAPYQVGMWALAAAVGAAVMMF